MFRFFKKIFNIQCDSNQRWLLITMSITTLLITYVHPMLLKTIISSLPPQWISFESMTFSIVGMLIGMSWRGKLRENAIKYFLYLAITESVCGFLLGMYLTFVEFNIWAYAIASLIYGSLITTFVGKCILYFKSVLWNNRKRELYDNNVEILGGFLCFVGYAVSLFAMPSLRVSVFLWGVVLYY